MSRRVSLEEGLEMVFANSDSETEPAVEWLDGDVEVSQHNHGEASEINIKIQDEHNDVLLEDINVNDSDADIPSDPADMNHDDEDDTEQLDPPDVVTHSCLHDFDQSDEALDDGAWTKRNDLNDHPEFTQRSGLVDQPEFTQRSGLVDQPEFTQRSGLVDQPEFTQRSGLVDQPSEDADILYFVNLFLNEFSRC